MVRPGLPPTAGNTVTARRLAEGLRAEGVDARILSADALPGAPRPGPGEVVHALHARLAGVPAVHWARGSPVIWTFTGTDLGPGERAAVASAARRVAAFVAFHAQQAEELRRELGVAPASVRVIAPGVDLSGFAGGRRGPESAAPRAAEAEPMLFLLPAGIREVKDPDLAVAAVEAVRRAGSDAALAVAGPSRDDAFCAAFLERLRAAPFARYIGEVPRAEMPGWYARAAVVLNTSRAEGLSNAVLEAMALGRPVLATDIAGNRAAIRHGTDGWLAAPSVLPEAAAMLAADRELRRRLGRAAAEAVRARFAIQAEVAAHLRLYAEVLAGGPAPHPGRRGR